MNPPLPLMARAASATDSTTLTLQVLLLVIIAAFAGALIASTFRHGRPRLIAAEPVGTGRQGSPMADPERRLLVEDDFIPDGDQDVAIDDVTYPVNDGRHPFDEVDFEGGTAAGYVMPDDNEWLRQELIRRFPQLEDYPMLQCRAFVGGLGDGVLHRALIFFTLIRDRGGIDSVELAKYLGVPARTISGGLTGRIARRAAELGVPIPYSVRRQSGHTVWVDRSGIAGRMVMALGEERTKRLEAHAAAESDRA